MIASLGWLLAALSAGVEVRVTPGYLRLGTDSSAEVRIEAPAGPLHVRCSSGRVDDLREVAPGSWIATYVPAAERVPRVALIVARSGNAVGAAALPLWGEGDAQIRTRPGGVADVRIGEMIFGPFRAGRDGRATAPVLVPPGVDFALQGQRAIDLHVPRTRTVQIAPLDEEVQNDRERTVEVAIAAVTRGGAPFEGELQLTASLGTVEVLPPLQPGLYLARWRIPPGAQGTARLRATVRGDPEPSQEEVRLVEAPTPCIDPELPAVAAAPSGPQDIAAARLEPPPLAAESTAPLEATPGLHGLALSPKAGMLTDFRSLRAPTIGAEAALRTRWRAFQVAAVLGLAFATSSDSGTATAGSTSTSFRARDDLFLVSAAIALRYPAAARTVVWAQAGAVLVAASAHVQVGASGDPLRSDTTSRGAVPGIELGAGVERQMWGGAPFIEAIWLATRSFALPNLDGAIVGLCVRAGYRFELM